jgi:hypothetical protein
LTGLRHLSQHCCIVGLAESVLYTTTTALPLTATLVTVCHASGRAVISSADDSFLLDNDAAHSSLHTVTPQGCKVGELHEVLVPARAESSLVGEVQ